MRAGIMAYTRIRYEDFADFAPETEREPGLTPIQPSFLAFKINYIPLYRIITAAESGSHRKSTGLFKDKRFYAR